MNTQPTPGLYEQLLTPRLESLLRSLQSSGYVVETERLDEGEAHVFLAKAIHQVVLQALRSITGDQRLQQQLELCNRILDAIVAATDSPWDASDHLLPDLLTAILVPASGLVASPHRLQRPGIPLSQSALLVNAPRDHRIGSEIIHEIASADRIDLLCSFIKWSGFVRLREALAAHCQRGKPLRILTTAYMGATEGRALDELHAMGAEICVSYNTRRTRLHAKAWLFHRDSGFATAYIGSSNLSAAALSDGLEWNVRVSGVELPAILEKFIATFENYWHDPEFEPYTGAASRSHFDQAIRAEQNNASDQVLANLDVRPYPYQQEILDRLWVEREVHQQWRNLVVAATGTGKTVMAALDYQSVVRRLGPQRLLFIAHRAEILKQSLATFRQVLRDGQFGELYVEGKRPSEGAHVFASIQSLSHLDLTTLPPDSYDVVIIDEVHHAAASTYEAVLQHFRPRLLLGLTATPERADGKSILGWFDGRIGAELRLWEAIDRGLLSPFQYFAIHDNTDLSHLRWVNGRYDVSELDGIYTGNDARVRLIVQAISNHVADPSRMRALGFCVSVRHAEYMAAQFQRLGISAEAVTGETERNRRAGAVRDLREGRIQVLFTVDLFNEGIDIPEVDTLLFLRPTESATLFQQQLGRGLRLYNGKECLTVLDFVGQTHPRFRFDLHLRALTGTTLRGLYEQIAGDFPYLPSGCAIHLDRVAKEIVLDNLRQAVTNNRHSLVQELRRLGPAITLASFLHETKIELEIIYRGGRSWTDLCRSAGMPMAAAGPQEAQLARAMNRLLHLDDPNRLRLYQAKLAAAHPPALATSAAERRQLAMLAVTLFGPDAVTDPEGAFARLWQHPAMLDELQQLFEVLFQRITHRPIPWRQFTNTPLQIHCHYSLDEIMAAFNDIRQDRLYRPREGVVFQADSRCNLLFVTLQKTEKDYSPSTMYEDYALSPWEFHWQSQRQTRADSISGRRHWQHHELEITPLLFVRERKKDERGVTVPYQFLGPVKYVQHQGELPMSIIWHLLEPMPIDTFRAARVAAV